MFCYHSRTNVQLVSVGHRLVATDYRHEAPPFVCLSFEINNQTGLKAVCGASGTISSPTVSPVALARKFPSGVVYIIYMFIAKTLTEKGAK